MRLPVGLQADPHGPDWFETDLSSAYADASTILFYDKVSVLAFYWENDNLDVVPLENELLNVFQNDLLSPFRPAQMSIPTPHSSDT